jgi:uncharacterized repeat protein (TIGR01451 family)/LPXTG-motif cell wall-anchored protein
MSATSQARRLVLGVTATVALVLAVASAPFPSANTASASDSDNPNYTFTSSVSGPILTTPTVTVSLELQKRRDEPDFYLNFWEATPTVPDGTVIMCDDTIGDSESPLTTIVGDPTASFIPVPPSRLVTHCTATFPNLPGVNTRTFRIVNFDENPRGSSETTVTWTNPMNACESDSIFGLRTLGPPLSGPSTIDAIDAQDHAPAPVASGVIPALPNPPYSTSVSQNGLMIDPIRNRIMHVTAPDNVGSPTRRNLMVYDPANGGWYVGATFDVPAAAGAAVPQRGAFTRDGIGYLQTLSYGGAPASALNAVWRIESSGTFSYTVTDYTPINGEAAPIGGDLAFDAHGVGWVIDQQTGTAPRLRGMKRWDPATSTLTGAFAISWAGNPVQVTNTPAGLAFDRSGNAYVSIANTFLAAGGAGNGPDSNSLFRLDMATGALTPFTASISASNTTDQYWIDLASCTAPDLTPGRIKVSKTLISPVASIGPDSELTYRIRLSNPGETAVTVLGSEVVETVPTATTAIGGDSFSCAAGAVAGTSCAATANLITVAAGASVDLQFRVRTVAVGFPTNGEISNHVVITGPNAPDCSAPENDCTEVTPTTARAITLTKTADPRQITQVGELVTYHFLVQNTGETAIRDLSVVETSFNGSGELSRIVCPTATLDRGASTSCTATYRATARDFVDLLASGEDLRNEAVANGTDAFGPIASAPSSARVALAEERGLRMVKSADRSQIVAAGTAITYQFLVTNLGNLPVHDLEVEDVMDNGRVLPVSCPTDSLAAGETTTCTATYTVPVSEFVPFGSVDNRASASGVTDRDDPVASNVDTVEIPVRAPAITVTKYVDDVTPTAPTGATADGQDSDANHHPVISTSTAGHAFSFVVTNSGSVALTDVVVVDADLGTISCPSADLAVGESMVCTATGSIPVGIHSATATATGTSSLDPTSSTTDSDPTSTSLAPGSIGDRAWHDLNGDGIQDANEPGLAGVTVTLTKLDTNERWTAITDSDGRYLFGQLAPGSYTVEFTTPDGFVLAPTGIGGPDQDSNGLLTTVTVTAGSVDLTIDVGFARNVDGGSTTTTTEPTTTTTEPTTTEPTTTTSEPTTDTTTATTEPATTTSEPTTTEPEPTTSTSDPAGVLAPTTSASSGGVAAQGASPIRRSNGTNLPRTGSNTMPLAWSGGALVMGGALAIAAARRRRRSA